MGRLLDVEVGPACIISGYCRSSAPDVFGVGPDRETVVKANPVEDSAALREALESCPVEAISARDADTGESVFPEL
jgi:ferredoxin